MIPNPLHPLPIPRFEPLLPVPNRLLPNTDRLLPFPVLEAREPCTGINDRLPSFPEPGFGAAVAGSETVLLGDLFQPFEDVFCGFCVLGFPV